MAQSFVVIGQSPVAGQTRVFGPFRSFKKAEGVAQSWEEDSKWAWKNRGEKAVNRRHYFVMPLEHAGAESPEKE